MSDDQLQARDDREALEDLDVDDESAEQVGGGETATTTPTQYRGRYQLKLGEAQQELGS
jgi:hypothetical protein